MGGLVVWAAIGIQGFQQISCGFPRFLDILLLPARLAALRWGRGLLRHQCALLRRLVDQ